VLSSSVEKKRVASYEKQAWIAIWGFSFVIAAPLLIGAGRILILLFPVSAFATGIFLYWRAPILYIGFTWWLMFLGALIRRIIDYQSGYLTFGPWGFTPMLVASISIATFIKQLPRLHKQGDELYTLCIASLSYAFLIGVLRNPANAVVNGTLDWLCPILLSFHLFINWQEYPAYRRVLQQTFFWGVLVMSIYGIIQFVFAPAWDKFWLNNITAESFGKPEPFGIRVSSSVGSPQACAMIILAGLIIVFCESGNPLSFIATGFGYLSFFLTMARSVWLSGIIGVPLFLLSLKPSIQMRMVLFTAIIVVIVIAIISQVPFAEDILSRFESFSKLESDISFNERARGYDQLIDLALVEFVGRGIGFSTAVFKTGIGANDGAILPTLFTLGWFGLVPYLTGLLLLVLKLFQGRSAGSDKFSSAARAITLCILAQLGLNSVLVGQMGMVLWSFLGIGLAANEYHRASRL
jgi:hypothetical protein